MATEGPTERRAFTFDWGIEQFSHWEQVNSSFVLESPRFKSRVLDGCVFRLHLFPRGVDERDSDVMLAIKTLIRFCPQARVDCEWSCMDAEWKRPIMTRSLKNQRLVAGSRLYFPPGPLQKEVFETEKEDYIPGGNLAVRCRIWYSDKDLEENELISARTRTDIRADSFMWPIEKFSTLQLRQKVAPPVETNFFPYQKQPLILNFTLKGKSLEESSVGFEVILRPLTQLVWFSILISVTGIDGTLIENVRARKLFNPSPISQVWNIEGMVSRHWLLQRGEDCLRDDVLKLLFTGEFSHCSGNVLVSRCGDLYVNWNSQKATEDLGEIVRHSEQYDQLDRLSQTSGDSVTTLLYDFQTMFEDHTASDFELRSGKFAYPVHKSVLSVRSIFFKTLFEEQNTIRHFDVENIRHKILHTFLVYLYTGNAGYLHFRDAVELYHAAEEYHIPTLKRECSSVLRSNTLVSNVFDVLTVAMRYQDMELMSFVSDFVARHYDQVILSDKWKAFQLSDSYFARKIIQEINRKKVEFENQAKDQIQWEEVQIS